MTKKIEPLKVDHAKVRETISSLEKSGAPITLKLLASTSGYRYKDLYGYECYMKYLNPRALAKRAQAVIDRKNLIEELDRALAAAGEKEIQLMPIRRRGRTSAKAAEKIVSIRKNARILDLEELENRLLKNGISTTYQNIGNLVGLTKQRVQQIYKTQGRVCPTGIKKSQKVIEFERHLQTLDVSKMTKQEICESIPFEASAYFTYSMIQKLPYKRAYSQSAFIVAVRESGIDPKSMSAAALARKLGFTHLSNPSRQLKKSGMR